MLMFDKTTNRHRGETDPHSLCCSFHVFAFPLLRFPDLVFLQFLLGIYWSSSSPPGPSFLWAELEETNSASLISQSVNRDQDKASLSTSSPSWVWSIMTAYQLCPGLLARKGREARMSAEQQRWKVGGGGKCVNRLLQCWLLESISWAATQRGLVSEATILYKMFRPVHWTCPFRVWLCDIWERGCGGESLWDPLPRDQQQNGERANTVTPPRDWETTHTDRCCHLETGGVQESSAQRGDVSHRLGQGPLSGDALWDGRLHAGHWYAR